MGLSKFYLDTNDELIEFQPAILADMLKSAIPDIIFAYLMGSAACGQIKPHSDIDIALYIHSKPSFDIISQTQIIVDKYVGPVRADVGFLNGAEPVYRFEALKGKLLFTRDQSRWLDFYSITCREYESQLVDYERQRRYRLEAALEV